MSGAAEHRLTNVDAGQRLRPKHAVTRDYSVGPRFLLLVSVVAVAVGVAMMYTQSVSVPSYLLFFFFLPVASVSVVLGSFVGLAVAVLAVAGTLAPSIWLGLDVMLGDFVGSGEGQAVVSTWAVFLLATAYLVGWVSEHGGSLSLTQGLGGKAIRAIEVERRRTGQDIHDGIAQYAAAAFLETEVLAGLTLDADPHLHKQAEKVKHSLGLLIDEARSMVGTLRPPALGPVEFDASLFKLVQNFRDGSGISADLELEGQFASHTDSARICLYRTLQEALANVERHSGANAVRIWAKASKGSVDLIVSDNGKGFPLDVEESERGPARFGLSGMRERAGYLGGRLTIKSEAGVGTTIVLHIPKYEGNRRGWF